MHSLTHEPVHVLQAPMVMENSTDTNSREGPAQALVALVAHHHLLEVAPRLPLGPFKWITVTPQALVVQPAEAEAVVRPRAIWSGA